MIEGSSNRLHGRKRRGHCSLEIACGGIVIIMIAMFSMDVLTIYAVKAANDHVACSVARFIGQAPRGNDGKASSVAVDKVKQRFTSKYSGSDVSLKPIVHNYTNNNEEVEITTQMTLRLPVPIPFASEMSYVTLSSCAKAPVVGTAIATGGSASATDM